MFCKYFMAGTLLFTTAFAYAEDCVVLLHGLASHPLVMKPLELAIDIQPEFRTVNQGYNSYKADIVSLANSVVPEAIERCDVDASESVHFVTHSMGGLLLRAYLQNNEIASLDRIVMIAPPNGGSEIVDWVQQFYWLENVLGPAGKQLGTDDDDIPALLSSPNINMGIIAGTKENLIFWRRILPPENDGKVSTQSTQLDEMHDYREIEEKHSGLLFERETAEQVLSFLRYGEFDIDDLHCQI